VQNYTGRARVDVWLTGDIADFSDYTDVEEDEEERLPAKKLRRS
jgi:hypothetical protein